MPDQEPTPVYRYRGSVKPCAEVSRPVAVQKNAAKDGESGTSATLDIFDVIDSCGGWWGISAQDVDRALKQLGDVDTLNVRINSPGGQATEGVAIANVLRSHPAAVHVTVMGIAASAASVIAAAGDVVTMAPGSMLMVHDASDFVYGRADEMRGAAQALDVISDSYAGLYALKAGGTADDWRAVMKAETWMTAEDAITSKIADKIGIDTADGPALPDDEEDDDLLVDVTVEITPAARAAARFDLSMFSHVPEPLAPAARAKAPKTPAEPVPSPTNTKEADAMSDTIPAWLREGLGLAEDADDASVQTAFLEKVTKPDPAPAAASDVKAITAALEADGKVVVSKARFDALEAQAADGAQARAKQIVDARDELIEAAMSAGKISRAEATRTVWEKEFARDFDSAKADLEALPARFPVTAAPGHLGGAEGDSAKAFSEDEASALASLTGTSKEALLS
ncbi:head maturation protease, ClpP-related [Jatrophihabitans sp.]|uniref:head maturation protease, ClpP-related n=1 Tax=Jatrophihabitans sp. TaxID=1932789 RepID=UPI0030C6908D|nr:peptidase ClpP [Jatrophihabitans sp.]